MHFHCTSRTKSVHVFASTRICSAVKQCELLLLSKSYTLDTLCDYGLHYVGLDCQVPLKTGMKEQVVVL